MKLGPRCKDSMLDLAEFALAFQAAEVETVRQSYAYALSYLPPLGSADQRFLARLTIMAAAARCRQNKTVTSIVDAHAIAAEVTDFYAALRNVGVQGIL